MRKFPVIILLLVLAAAMVPLLSLLSGCDSDVSRADRLVRDSETLRISASDKFRKATMTVDGLVKGAATGATLEVDNTRNSSRDAVAQLVSAQEDLDQRGTKIEAAQKLSLGENYVKYLALLKASNDRLRTAISSAQEIPMLLKDQQYSLAGWDQIKTRDVVAQVYTMETKLEQIFTDASTLHNQADQIKKDNPEEFGE